jgi:predicted RNA methylase
MSTFDNFIIAQSKPYFNYKHIKMVPESRYSSLMPWHIDQVSECVLKETEHLKINNIIDATAHIGVDTILFRLLFPTATIVAIELDQNVYQLLQHNINNINLITNSDTKSIITKNVDSLQYIFNPYFDLNNVDLIYFDPPWGDAYTQPSMDLTLSGHHMGDIVNDIILNSNTLVVVKMPYNIDLQAFKDRAFKNIDGYFNLYNIYTKNKKVSYMLAFFASY